MQGTVQAHGACTELTVNPLKFKHEEKVHFHQNEKRLRRGEVYHFSSLPKGETTAFMLCCVIICR